MANIRDLFGYFGDFQTLVHDAELQDFIIRLWGTDGGHQDFYMVGATILPDNDVMCHLVIADESTKDYSLKEIADTYGIAFSKLSIMLANGLEIHKIPWEGGEDDAS